MLKVEKNSNHFSVTSGRFGDVSLIKKLGEGGNGNVFECRISFPFSRHIVVKVEPFNCLEREEGTVCDGKMCGVCNEIRVFKQINNYHGSHPGKHFVVNYIGSLVIEEEDGKWGLQGNWMLLERWGISLRDYLSPFKENITPHFTLDSGLFLFSQIREGLDFLMRMNYCHLDLKLENLLFSKEAFQLKICDFGLAVPIQNNLELVGSENNPVMSTITYIPPEMLISHSSEDFRGFPAVSLLIYQLGCVFVEMTLLNGRNVVKMEGWKEERIPQFHPHYLPLINDEVCVRYPIITPADLNLNNNIAKGVIVGTLQIQPAQRVNWNQLRNEMKLEKLKRKNTSEHLPLNHSTPLK